MSYKVAVKVYGESTPAYNGLRFATKEEAENNAKDLFSRWSMMKGWAIEESKDEVNYQWTDEGLVAVPNVPKEEK